MKRCPYCKRTLGRNRQGMTLATCGGVECKRAYDRERKQKSRRKAADPQPVPRVVEAYEPPVFVTPWGDWPDIGPHLYAPRDAIRYCPPEWRDAAQALRECPAGLDAQIWLDAYLTVRDPSLFDPVGHGGMSYTDAEVEADRQTARRHALILAAYEVELAAVEAFDAKIT